MKLEFLEKIQVELNFHELKFMELEFQEIFFPKYNFIIT